MMRLNDVIKINCPVPLLTNTTLYSKCGNLDETILLKTKRGSDSPYSFPFSWKGQTCPACQGRDKRCARRTISDIARQGRAEHVIDKGREKLLFTKLMKPARTHAHAHNYLQYLNCIRAVVASSALHSAP